MTAAASFWDKYTVFIDRGKDSSGHVCVQDFVLLLALSSQLSARFFRRRFHLQSLALYLMTHRRYRVSPFSSHFNFLPN